MMKKFFVFFLSSIFMINHATAANCRHAVSTDHPNFCQSFESAAKCRCYSAGYPGFICNDLDRLYDVMLLVFFSQKRACMYQQETTFETCMDDWNCYRLGGKDARGRLCSASGKSCKTLQNKH